MLEAAFPDKPVLADAAYGNSGRFRQGLRDRKLTYSVAIKPTTSIWRPNEGPDPIAEYKGSGRRSIRRLPGEFQPISVAEFARELAPSRVKTLRLTRGYQQPKKVRAAFARIRTAHGAYKGQEPGNEEWLIVIWPEDQQEPTDYFLSNLGRRMRPKRLLEITCLRWRVERDYHDMKQEVGLEHYEGRTWVGFHHHLTICMAAHAFLASQRKLFPPEASGVTGVGAKENCA